MICIRQLLKEEWPLLKALRLKALKTDQRSFWEDFAESQALEDSYWKNLTHDLTKNDGSRMFIAEDAGTILGFVYGIRTKHAHQYRIGGLWIEPSERKKGLGRLLVNEVIKWAKSNAERPTIGLWSPDDGTVTFYLSLGFRKLTSTREHPNDSSRRIVEMEIVH